MPRLVPALFLLASFTLGCATGGVRRVTTTTESTVSVVVPPTPGVAPGMDPDDLVGEVSLGVVGTPVIQGDPGWSQGGDRFVQALLQGRGAANLAPRTSIGMNVEFGSESMARAARRLPWSGAEPSPFASRWSLDLRSGRPIPETSALVGISSQVELSFVPIQRTVRQQVIEGPDRISDELVRDQAQSVRQLVGGGLGIWAQANVQLGWRVSAGVATGLIPGLRGSRTEVRTCLGSVCHTDRFQSKLILHPQAVPWLGIDRVTHYADVGMRGWGILTTRRGVAVGLALSVRFKVREPVEAGSETGEGSARTRSERAPDADPVPDRPDGPDRPERPDWPPRFAR